MPKGKVTQSFKTLFELEIELRKWAEGLKSHHNAIIYNPDDTDSFNNAIAQCAVADAAEVVKLSAAIQALVALKEDTDETNN